MPHDTMIRNEKDFTNRVRVEAGLAEWELVYHTHDSRHSEPGFPDLVMVRPPRIIFAELKMKKGKVSEHQKRWLDGLAEIQGIEVYTWRYPDDIDTILETLA
jgi:hypothetical protein